MTYLLSSSIQSELYLKCAADEISKARAYLIQPKEGKRASLGSTLDKAREALEKGLEWLQAAKEVSDPKDESRKRVEALIRDSDQLIAMLKGQIETSNQAIERTKHVLEEEALSPEAQAF